MPLDLITGRMQKKWLAKTADSVAIRQFLLKNLERTNNGFDWKFNLGSFTINTM